MTEEEEKKNCSAYTVIVYEEKDEIKVANTIDYYIKMGKSYEDIKTKLPERPGWRAIRPCEVMKENEELKAQIEKEHNLLTDIIESFTSQSLTDDFEMACTAREIAEILEIKNYR